MTLEKEHTKIEGDGNVVAQGNVTYNTINSAKESSAQEAFLEIDLLYASQINADMELKRQKQNTTFSSEGLFTSLVRIGLSYNDSLTVTKRAVDTLANQRSDLDDNTWIPTTLHLRKAVMQVIIRLSEDGAHSKSQVQLWFSAYIRRYGNPDNQFIKIIDDDAYRDLDFQYIKNIILPHVISRIIGLPKHINPLVKYSTTFSKSIVDDMAKAIIDYINVININALRYKTLIHLLQDIILEPPHPWIVNSERINKIVEYNLERSQYHLNNMLEKTPMFPFEDSVRECFQHLSATILAHYGSFLGVDSKYGLNELRRVLQLQKEQQGLWSFSNISMIENDLKNIDCDINALFRILSRVNDTLSSVASDREKKLIDYALRLSVITKKVALLEVVHIMPED